VVVSGAAGGVGSIAVQLARNAGAKVIGLASDANRKWLADHGVIPGTYGDGVGDRIRAASGGKVDAFIDTFGGGYVELAIQLGVAPNRIDTIIDFAAAAKYGVKTEGNYEAANGYTCFPYPRDDWDGDRTVASVRAGRADALTETVRLRKSEQTPRGHAESGGPTITSIAISHLP
jgi:NADPH:quinone reductase-like Zn-dependent oxidoreductase